MNLPGLTDFTDDQLFFIAFGQVSIYNIASLVGNLKIGYFFSFGAPTLPKLRFVQPSQLMNTVQGNSGEHLSQQRIPSLPPLIAERISARQLYTAGCILAIYVRVGHA